MTEDQVRLVRESWAKARPIAPAAFKLFFDRLFEIEPSVRPLGARHATYGVRDEHYAPVGAALLWTLEQGLGADFTDETRTAWATAYGILATAMMEASSSPRPPRDRPRRAGSIAPAIAARQGAGRPSGGTPPRTCGRR